MLVLDALTVSSSTVDGLNALSLGKKPCVVRPIREEEKDRESQDARDDADDDEKGFVLGQTIDIDE